MQFKLLAIFAASFFAASAVAQTDCVTIHKGSICPVGFRVCGPVQLHKTKCCPDEDICPL
ncbi:hypothetical protein C8F01DRAFT_1252891 [Mycena amicta]|nr:hypothetical protein C8F01DRAFT_1252891 [Mycena amicta]